MTQASRWFARFALLVVILLALLSPSNMLAQEAPSTPEAPATPTATESRSEGEDEGGGWWDRARDTGGNIVDGARDRVVDTAEGAWDIVRDAPGNIWDFISTIPESTWNFITGIPDAIVGFARGTWGFVTDLWSGATDPNWWENLRRDHPVVAWFLSPFAWIVESLGKVREFDPPSADDIRDRIPLPSWDPRAILDLPDRVVDGTRDWIVGWLTRIALFLIGAWVLIRMVRNDTIPNLIDHFRTAPSAQTGPNVPDTSAPEQDNALDVSAESERVHEDRMSKANVLMDHSVARTDTDPGTANSARSRQAYRSRIRRKHVATETERPQLSDVTPNKHLEKGT